MNSTSLQGLRARRAVADAVENFVVAVPHEALFCESLDSSVFRNSSRTSDADDFTFQVVHLCNALGAHQRVVHIRLHAADNR